MINTLVFLILIAGIFLLGFFGNIFFKKTKISDILILIIVGLLLGPILKVIPIPVIDLLRSFAPTIAAVALIVLLFDGGLYLNFFKVLNEIKSAFLFTIGVFILTVALCGVTLHFIFGFSWLYGFLLGGIIGGTCSAIIIPLATRSSATDRTKTILTLESAMTDVFCIITTITIVGLIISQSINAGHIVQGIFSAFAIATFIGIIGGFIWVIVLRDYTEAKNFNYLLTLSFLFLLYALTEYLNGNGAFCALVFGLVLGNASTILKAFKFKEFTIEKSMTHFQTEISLLVKTFFFVYLGIIIDLSIITINTILISAILILLILLIRWVIIKYFFGESLTRKDKEIMSALHARGLAAAVLATYPIGAGLINGFTSKIVTIAFIVILITNISTTVYLFLVEKNSSFKNLETKAKK